MDFSGLVVWFYLLLAALVYWSLIGLLGLFDLFDLFSAIGGLDKGQRDGEKFKMISKSVRPQPGAKDKYSVARVGGKEEEKRNVKRKYSVITL